MSEQLVQTVHDLGATIIAWTVDNASEMERLVHWQVDGICTNHPERTRRMLETRVK